MSLHAGLRNHTSCQNRSTPEYLLKLNYKYTSKIVSNSKYPNSLMPVIPFQLVDNYYLAADGEFCCIGTEIPPYGF